jgi:phosphatidylglycerol:prolipoprotein diacylglycerol transferase
MHPLFLQWGGLTISTYAVCMMLGLILGTCASLWEARRRQVRSASVLDAILAAVVAGVIAARLGYALINWTYYQDHLGEIPRLWLGGLIWQIGLLGGLIGAWLLARRAPAPWIVLDLLALGLPLAAACGWIGSYLSGTAFGKELYPGEPLFFLAVDVPDWYGQTAPRWPTQLLGAGLALALFLALWLTRRLAWPPGLRLWLFVVFYSLIDLLLGFTRGPDLPLLNGWRADQWLDAGLLLLGCFQWVRVWRRAKRA